MWIMRYTHGKIHLSKISNIVRSLIFISHRISADPRDHSGYFPRESRELSYGVIDKHVSTPTSSFFGTMMMEVNCLLVTHIIQATSETYISTLSVTFVIAV